MSGNKKNNRCACAEQNKGDDLIVCRCEEVTQKEILAAIAEGATSLNQIKRRTRAGMGLCQGRSCGKLVRRMLADAMGKKIGEVMPGTFRPPVRPIALKVLASLTEDYHEES